MSSVKAIPTGYHTVTPYLTVRGGMKLVEFLKQAFGAKEKEILKGPDGTLRHAEVQIGDSIVMIGEPRGQAAPKPANLYLYLSDTDETYRRALNAGAKSVSAPANQFYGDRSGAIEDPCGNQWWIATHIEDVSPEEMERRMQAVPA